jgi:hypothetical protein
MTRNEIWAAIQCHCWECAGSRKKIRQCKEAGSCWLWPVRIRARSGHLRSITKEQLEQIAEAECLRCLETEEKVDCLRPTCDLYLVVHTGRQ